LAISGLDIAVWIEVPFFIGSAPLPLLVFFPDFSIQAFESSEKMELGSSEAANAVFGLAEPTKDLAVEMPRSAALVVGFRDFYGKDRMPKSPDRASNAYALS
jgi:hypothetical protein